MFAGREGMKGTSTVEKDLLLVWGIGPAKAITIIAGPVDLKVHIPATSATIKKRGTRTKPLSTIP